MSTPARTLALLAAVLFPQGTFAASGVVRAAVAGSHALTPARGRVSLNCENNDILYVSYQYGPVTETYGNTDAVCAFRPRSMPFAIPYYSWYFDQQQPIAVAQNGDLYLVDAIPSHSNPSFCFQQSCTTAVFHEDASAPYETLQEPGTGLTHDSIVVDEAGTVYISQRENSAKHPLPILVYEGGSTSPTRSLTRPQKAGYAESMAADTSGNLFVVWYPAVCPFCPGALYEYSPGRNIPTELFSFSDNAHVSLAGVDQMGNLVITSSYGGSSPTTVSVYPPPYTAPASNFQVMGPVQGVIDRSSDGIWLYPDIGYGSSAVAYEYGLADGILIDQTPTFKRNNVKAQTCCWPQVGVSPEATASPGVAKRSDDHR